MKQNDIKILATIHIRKIFRVLQIPAEDAQ